jgi:hypothetical protein
MKTGHGSIRSSVRNPARMNWSFLETDARVKRIRNPASLEFLVLSHEAAENIDLHRSAPDTANG